MTRTRMTVLTTAAAGAVLALLLAGCSSGTARDGNAEAAPDAGKASAASFPVTIEGALGSATIPSEPKRVVTIGWGSADTVVALGTTPVGVEAASWGGDADGYFPWVRDAIEARGDSLPAVFDVYPEIDVEAVLALQPDLILAPQSGLSATEYATLSAFAPTVAFPEEAWRTGWAEQISIIGEALGKPVEAESLIGGINTELAAGAAEHPEFADLSFAYVYAAEPGALNLYQAGDPRVDLIAGLGLSIDATVAEIPITPGTFSSTVGLERADLLNNVDVLFTWYNDTANQDAIEAQPLFAQIPAVTRSSYVPNADNQLAMASSMVTPLSVPWALSEYVPMITAAAAAAAR